MNRFTRARLTNGIVRFGNRIDGGCLDITDPGSFIVHTTSTPSASSELASTPSDSSIASPSSSQVFSSPASSSTPISDLSTPSTPTPVSSITVSSSTPSATPSSTEDASSTTPSATPSSTEDSSSTTPSTAPSSTELSSSATPSATPSSTEDSSSTIVSSSTIIPSTSASSSSTPISSAPSTTLTTIISSTSSTSALPTQTAYQLIASSPNYAAANGQPARCNPNFIGAVVYLVAPSAAWISGEFVFEESTGYLKISGSNLYLAVDPGSYALNTVTLGSTSSMLKCAAPVQAGVALSCWQATNTARNAFFVTNISTSQTIAIYPSTLSVTTLSKIELVPQLVSS
ncbi:unnamed protein product [Clonostachys rosea]|uniref:PA14 domain-containing protein n=1 Tax=Bionectria ochroleuca TaxID=29856 RepID=A0ABY6UGW9_BIOOC|nr:unnamed protein product [Clonostachys rosea]